MLKRSGLFFGGTANQSVETKTKFGNRLSFLFHLDPQRVSIQSSIKKRLTRHRRRAVVGASEKQGGVQIMRNDFWLLSVGFRKGLFEQ